MSNLPNFVFFFSNNLVSALLCFSPPPHTFFLLLAKLNSKSTQSLHTITNPHICRKLLLHSSSSSPHCSMRLASCNKQEKLVPTPPQTSNSRKRNSSAEELDRLHPNPRSTLDSILGCSVERLMSECRSRQQTSKPSDRDSTRDLSSNPCIGKEMSACGLRKKSNLDSILECKVERLSECHSRQQTSKPSDRDCTPDLNASPAFVKDMLESKKALCQEYKSIRREIEQLKVKLELQEEHLFSQISASHDIKKTQRQYCRMLEDLICSHKAQTQDLNKARSETHSTQRELCRIKSTVTVLIEQVANLHLEDKLYAMAKKEKSLRCKKKKKKMNECVLAALLCECSSSECNLTDVCSDELCSDGELAGNKIFIPAMEQTATENNETMLDSEMCTTLPELNLSDLISLT